jgi:hypothetical protein
VQRLCFERLNSRVIGERERERELQSPIRDLWMDYCEDTNIGLDGFGDLGLETGYGISWLGVLGVEEKLL